MAAEGDDGDIFSLPSNTNKSGHQLRSSICASERGGFDERCDDVCLALLSASSSADCILSAVRRSLKDAAF